MRNRWGPAAQEVSGSAAYDDGMSSSATDERRPLRLARGVVVGAVGGLLAVAAHVLAGGTAPGAAAVVAVGLVVAGAAIASSRRWTPGRLVVALGGAQALVHAALWLASPAASADPRLAAAVLGRAAHPEHAHAAGTDLKMLLLHVVATAAAAVLLAALDRCALAVWAAVHAVRTVLARVLTPALRLAPPAGRPASAGTGLVVVGRRPRRGPPALLAPC